MTNVFTFRNEQTGETRKATAQSKNAAAHQVGIEVPYRGQLPAPWKAVSCHTPSGELLWTEE